MSKRLKRGAVVFVVAFAAAQLVRPELANPQTDPGRTIQAHMKTTSGLVSVLDRACRDCHSNNTEWPSYTRVAPVSWLMAYAVAKGRRAVNFSEWSAYPSDVQRMLLAVSCQDVSAGKMPGAYTWVRPETRLSATDIDTVCTAARQAEALTAEGAR
jgi:Haem-binding domain